MFLQVSVDRPKRDRSPPTTLILSYPYPVRRRLKRSVGQEVEPASQLPLQLSRLFTTSDEGATALRQWCTIFRAFRKQLVTRWVRCNHADRSPQLHHSMLRTVAASQYRHAPP